MSRFPRPQSFHFPRYRHDLNSLMTLSAHFVVTRRLPPCRQVLMLWQHRPRVKHMRGRCSRIGDGENVTLELFVEPPLKSHESLTRSGFLSLASLLIRGLLRLTSLSIRGRLSLTSFLLTSSTR